MVNPDLRQIMKDNSRRYSLVMATAKRAREIVDQYLENDEPLIEKPVSIAIEELEEGRLKFNEPEELRIGQINRGKDIFFSSGSSIVLDEADGQE